MTDIVGLLPRNGTQDTGHSIASITKCIIHHDAQWRPDEKVVGVSLKKLYNKDKERYDITNLV